MIEDIHSMHGTKLNQMQLVPLTPQPVRTNDTLVFGAEVRRERETFPACAFEIDVQISQHWPESVSRYHASGSAS